MAAEYDRFKLKLRKNPYASTLQKPAADEAATQETLYLLSIRGMRESIIVGMAEPIEACTKTLDW